MQRPDAVGTCGSLRSREDTIGYLNALVTLPTVSINEAMILIETRALFSRGIGLVDVQLLAATLISPETQLWTRDKRRCRYRTWYRLPRV